MTPDQLLNNILSDMRVELSDLFDRNFEKKGFFDEKWKERQKEGKGSLLHVTGAMRRSIRSAVRGRGVAFTSDKPYTAVHNEGGKFTQNVRKHTRRNKITGKTYTVKAHTRQVSMPKRQFIGDSKEVQNAVKEIIYDNLKQYFDELAKQIRR